MLMKVQSLLFVVLNKIKEIDEGTAIVIE